MSVNKNKKKYLHDDRRGCVAFIRVGVTYLCGCVAYACGRGWRADACKEKQNKKKEIKENRPDPGCGW